MSKPPMSDQMVQEVSELFSALGDPSRLKILRTLLDSKVPLSQGVIADKSGLSQANSSKHLSYLTRVGLVTRTPEGNTVFFHVSSPLVAEVCNLVCGHVSDRIKAAFHAIGK